MGKNKIALILISLISILLMLGCQEDASDDSYDIQDINIEGIQDISIQYYISYKTHYMNELVKMGSEPYFEYPNPNNDIDIQTTLLTKEVIYKIQNNKAKEYVSYGEEQKLDDFYKALIAKAELEKHFPGIMDTINEAVDSNISMLDMGTPLSIDDDSSINISSIIGEVANEFDMTYENAVDLIYRPYIVYDGIIQFHMMYFLKNNYDGEKVEYNGQNEIEYELFLIDYYKKHEMYLDNILHSF